MRQPNNKKADWATINTLTHRAAHRHIFQRRLTAAAVCATASSVGQDLFVVSSFREGCLKISVTSYDLVAEVMMRQEKLITAINSQLGVDEVQTLRISVAPVAKENDYE